MPKKAPPSIADAMRRIALADDSALAAPGAAPPAADTGRPASRRGCRVVTAHVDPSTGSSGSWPPASRRGCRVVTAHVDPAVHRQLRILAIRQDTSGQALLLEALGDLFQKYGLPRIVGNPHEDKTDQNHATRFHAPGSPEGQ